MRKDSGQTLIEVLIALSIGIIIIIAVTVVVLVSLDNAGFNKNENLANAYAQEGLEVVRGIKDRSWSDFWSLPGGPNQCLPENATELVRRTGPDCDGLGNITGGFIREVTVRNNNSDCTLGGIPSQTSSKVTVMVQWLDNRCPTSGGNKYCHEVRLISCFVKLNTVPIP
jgi:type II secretory pathway pseudopilin PulG